MSSRSLSFAGSLCRLASLGLLSALMAACVAGSSTVGGGNIPQETRLRIEGTPGTPFKAMVTDTAASWEFSGVVPLSVALFNNQPPVRMFAAKLAGDTALLSAEIVLGGAVTQVSSTNAPFGTVVVQTSKGLSAIAPAASPDVRFLVKGARGEYFNGVIEDLNRGFQLSDTAPTLFFFENPDGRVDGFFNQGATDVGPLNVDLLIGGLVVAHGVGAPSVTVVSP